ncbi:hypothetical protein [Geodermatophilus sp. FMUSA9-8]|uniref:hypothetical protein n=1 Tax=Geodermatophilus sp. FMUSA9-8 TaxID=3120155 RepID=UPI0030090A1D
MSDDLFDPDTQRAISELLTLGATHGIGVTFTPDDEGWTVGYMVGHGGGNLVAGYDLGETVRAALRPLDQLGNERERARQERSQPR